MKVDLFFIFLLISSGVFAYNATMTWGENVKWSKNTVALLWLYTAISCFQRATEHF